MQVSGFSLWVRTRWKTRCGERRSLRVPIGTNILSREALNQNDATVRADYRKEGNIYRIHNAQLDTKVVVQSNLLLNVHACRGIYTWHECW